MRSYKLFDYCLKCEIWYKKSDKVRCPECNKILRKKPKSKRWSIENIVRY